MHAPENLKQRAERGAAAIIAEYGLAELGVRYDVLLAVIAVGWVEGWAAGGEEAREVVREFLAEVTGAKL